MTLCGKQILYIVCCLDHARGLLLGILGGGVLPGSPNPDPISDQRMSLFTPIFRPGLKEIMSLLLRLEQPVFPAIFIQWPLGGVGGGGSVSAQGQPIRFKWLYITHKSYIHIATICSVSFIY